MLVQHCMYYFTEFPVFFFCILFKVNKQEIFGLGGIIYVKSVNHQPTTTSNVTLFFPCLNKDKGRKKI